MPILNLKWNFIHNRLSNTILLGKRDLNTTHNVACAIPCGLFDEKKIKKVLDNVLLAKLLFCLANKIILLGGIMKKTKCAILILSLSCSQAFALLPYAGAKQVLENAPSSVQRIMEKTPQIYAFSSRFDGKDSVSFPVPTLQHALVNGLKIFMGSLRRGAYPGGFDDAMEELEGHFSFAGNGEGSIGHDFFHRIKTKDLDGNPMDAAEGATYGDLLRALGFSHLFPWKTLGDSIAQGALRGVGNDIFPGVDLLKIDADQNGDPFVEAEDLILAMFQIVAKNATGGESFTVRNGDFYVERIHDAAITKTGINLKEMVNKLLHGAVALYQASAYLGGDVPGEGLNAENLTPHSSIMNYTALEYNWDQAFGHFGAARDFALYSDWEVSKKLSMDSDQDGKISLVKEKNLGIAVNSARIDRVAQRDGEGGMDLSKEVIEAFVAGRRLIAEKPPSYLQYVRASAAVALGAWERVLGGVVIHYLNSTLKIMDVYGTGHYSFANHAKFWSEMKGYGLAFQFNPGSSLTSHNFERFHQLIGDRPILMSDGEMKIEKYKKDLLRARDILQKAFGFSKINTEAF